MKPSRIVPSLLVLSVVGFAAGYFLSFLYDCGNSTFCYFLFSRVGNPLLYGMGALALVFLALLFVPKAFSAWWKFAIWFVPLAFLVFITAPEPQGWVSPIPAPQVVFQWMSGLYLGISAVIIATAAAKK